MESAATKKKSIASRHANIMQRVELFFLQIDKKLFTWLTPRDVHDRPQFTALICVINNPVPKSEYAGSFLVTVCN